MEDVRDAISRGELVLHYQPKLDLATREVTGVAALVRWQHPARGLLSPDRFLSLFEQSGLIGPLALTVLELAVAQQAEWAHEGVDVSMAVNLVRRAAPRQGRRGVRPLEGGPPQGRPRDHRGQR